MYVYIFEDGTVQKHPEGPTKEDLASIADGLLIVLRADGVKNIDTCGREEDLEDCEIDSDQGCPPCHCPK